LHISGLRGIRAHHARHAAHRQLTRRRGSGLAGEPPCTGATIRSGALAADGANAVYLSTCPTKALTTTALAAAGPNAVYLPPCPTKPLTLPAMAVCGGCGRFGPDDARFCSACGSPLA